MQSVTGKRRLGVAVSTRFMDSPRYNALVSEKFDGVVAENEAKMDHIMSGTDDNPRFGEFGSIVSTAEANGQYVRGHAFIFSTQDPPAAKRAGVLCALAPRHRKAEVRSRSIEGMNGYISAVGGRYAGRVGEWDVVNEPLQNNGTLKPDTWNLCIGPDYMGKAFEAARAADPQAKLYLNEIGAERAGPKRDGLVKLISGLQKMGVPIDGVGLQSHLDLSFLDHVEEFKETLKIFANMGLIIKLTELDVALPENPTAADLQKQTEVYVAVARACIEQRACSDIFVWGASDSESWNSKNSPTLFGFNGINYVEKPAYKKVRRLLR